MRGRTGRSSAFLVVMLIVSLVAAGVAGAQTRVPLPGDLDLTFNGTGKFVQAYNGWVGAIAVDQTSGNIVFASLAPGGMNVVDLNPDGSFDTSFGGGDGMVTIPSSPASYYPSSLAIDSAGRIVVVGVSSTWPHGDALVVRVLSDGTPDTSFSGDGIEVFSFGKHDSTLEDVSIGAGDKIIASGRIETYADYFDMLVLKLTSSGAVDTTFSGDGILQITKFPRQNLDPSDVELQPDGKIVVAGGIWSDNPAFGVARLLPRGKLDTSFSADGIASANISRSFDWPLGLGLLPNGKIVLMGTEGGDANKMDVARFTPKGGLDKSFSGDGMTMVKMPNGRGYVETAAMAPDGTLIFAGGTRNAFERDMEVARLGADGTLDTSFGIGGAALAQFANRSTDSLWIVFMPDGRIVVGASDNATPAIARFIA